VLVCVLLVWCGVVSYFFVFLIFTSICLSIFGSLFNVLLCFVFLQILLCLPCFLHPSLSSLLFCVCGLDQRVQQFLFQSARRFFHFSSVAAVSVRPSPSIYCCYQVILCLSLSFFFFCVCIPLDSMFCTGRSKSGSYHVHLIVIK